MKIQFRNSGRNSLLLERKNSDTTVIVTWVKSVLSNWEVRTTLR